MWLINTGTFKLEYVPVSKGQKYAILLHTWQEDEVFFKDMEDIQRAQQKKGWDKIKQTCRLAREKSLPYAWVDTCCIDKSSSAELSEAINSMFDWYQGSKICFVHFSDFDNPRPPVSQSEFQRQLGQCRWFTRGWTLQELICPWTTDFYDATWAWFGNKISLLTELSAITGMDENILQCPPKVFGVPVGKRMSWASLRDTTRGEDMAYSLLGIFRVHMPLLYGEGAENAFERLQDQIVSRHLDELSVFAWTTSDRSFRGLFAKSPREFMDCGHFEAPTQSWTGELSVVGNKMELMDPVYDTITPSDEPIGPMNLDLDLNIIERSKRTNNIPLWVTLPLTRWKAGQKYLRRGYSSAPELNYSSARPWLYLMNKPNPKILLMKTAENLTPFRTYSWVRGRLDDSLQPVLHQGRFQGSVLHSYDHETESPHFGNAFVAFHPCHFSCRGPGVISSRLSLGFLTVNIGCAQDLVTIILLHGSRDRSDPDPRKVIQHRAKVLLELIPPNADKALQHMRSGGRGSDDGELALAFDYAFQYMKDPFEHDDGGPEEGYIPPQSLDIEDGETSSSRITHRFTVDGVSTTKIHHKANPSDMPGYSWSDELTLRYERLELQSSIPITTPTRAEMDTRNG